MPALLKKIRMVLIGSLFLPSLLSHDLCAMQEKALFFCKGCHYTIQHAARYCWTPGCRYRNYCLGCVFGYHRADHKRNLSLTCPQCNKSRTFECQLCGEILPEKNRFRNLSCCGYDQFCFVCLVHLYADKNQKSYNLCPSCRNPFTEKTVSYLTRCKNLCQLAQNKAAQRENEKRIKQAQEDNQMAQEINYIDLQVQLLAALNNLSLNEDAHEIQWTLAADELAGFIVQVINDPTRPKGRATIIRDIFKTCARNLHLPFSCSEAAINQIYYSQEENSLLTFKEKDEVLTYKDYL